MVRKVLGFAMFMTLLAMFGGCGGGYSEQKATDRCNQEKFAKVCMTDKVYDECIACYEQCGDQCFPQNKCPEVYSCE